MGGVSWNLYVCLLLVKGEEESGKEFRDAGSLNSRTFGFRGTWSPTTSWCRL